jgi:uncharacterized protein (TIGR01777 family)
MKILITGGTGFIGRELCKNLREKKHQLTVLSRKPETVTLLCGPDVQAINNLDNLSANDQFDAIINLAGEGIADARWSPSRKQILLDSRVKVTAQLIAFIDRAQKKPGVLISGSAVGYYGNQGAAVLDENSAFKDGFSNSLCAEWEAVAEQAKSYGVRVCIIRTGLVVGAKGGFLKRMLLPFKLGLGGRLGDGRQWMSWIHMKDYIRIMLLMLETNKLEGIFNATAPNPVSNDQFTCCLAKNLSRPAFLPVPAFALKLLMGEMSELLLGGQRVLPKRLQQENFEFEFTTLEQALQDVL